MAALLAETADTVLEANAADVAAAEAGGHHGALVDRLRLDRARLDDDGRSRSTCSPTPRPRRPTPCSRSAPTACASSSAAGPVGVIGANFEARPNVVVDVASQLMKSRNAGVLRTGGAALASATALVEAVVAPALGRRPASTPTRVVLVADARRECAVELVRHRSLVPLVILRGTGDTTRSLGLEAAQHGVRTLAHADGGGVLYVDRAAARRPDALAGRRRRSTASGCATASTSCSSTATAWDELVPGLVDAARRARPRAPRCPRTTTPWATSGRSTTATRPR